MAYHVMTFASLSIGVHVCCMEIDRGFGLLAFKAIITGDVSQVNYDNALSLTCWSTRTSNSSALVIWSCTLTRELPFVLSSCPISQPCSAMPPQACLASLDMQSAQKTKECFSNGLKSWRVLGRNEMAPFDVVLEAKVIFQSSFDRSVAKTSVEGGFLLEIQNF
ncbi:hypothetical protein VNO77_22830 [Canavalia gladiata]|uniref:Uncharacterized protein n=1 Tax=Canavalia gladiata TaxID=3824 RepID=A0AAN9QEU5_CANGL